MSEEVLSSWIKSVEDQFAGGPPDGAALEWDRHRFELQVRDFAKPFKYYNRTSFDNKYCNTYQVAIDRPEEDRWLLLVQVSFIVDAYIMWWTHYLPTGRTQVGQVHPDNDIQGISENMRAFLNGQAFIEVPMDWYRTKLPQVELQISKPEDVILGKCLFEDHSG